MKMGSRILKCSTVSYPITKRSKYSHCTVKYLEENRRYTSIITVKHAYNSSFYLN